MHIVVIGAGVFGAWTAHHLHAAGVRVTLVDAYGPGNPRSSSGDYSRILRCGYGPDAIYSLMAWRSLEQWRDLDRRLGRGRAPVWYRCGVLWLAPSGDDYAAATIRTLEQHGLPLEILDDSEIRQRFPHLETPDRQGALLEPEAGVVTARRATRLLVAELARSGVSLVRGRAESPRGRRVDVIRLGDGTEISGDGFVFAAGAWLPAVFPELLAGRIRPTRQTVVYFGVPPGDVTFGPARTPAWVDFPAGVYGVPDIDDRGLKVGIDEHGPPMDPDTDDRIADASAIARARTWLSRRLPGMKDAPVLEARVCQYENTSTGDFLIDRHPAHDNVWIVGGGSGHGFKHGPAIGEDAARMVLRGDAPDERFALAGKTTDARRVVY